MDGTIEEIGCKLGYLKGELKVTDYVVVKIMEADTEEERAQLRQKYTDIINQRRQWRAQINQLEEQIKQME